MHYTVCDYVLDLFQNALEAGSERTHVSFRETRSKPATEASRVAVEIQDTGRGMTAEQQGRAMDPFVTDGEKHPGRRVGLGLPFLAQIVEATDGHMELTSAPGSGTRLAFELDAAHIDAPPLGDLPATFMQMLCFEGEYELEIERELSERKPEYDVRAYRLSRHELRDALGELETAASLTLLRQYLLQQEAQLHNAED